MAFRNVDNESFPAKASKEFFQALESNSNFLGKGEAPIPCSYRERARKITDNPVAAVLEYKAFISNILSIVFGLPPNSMENDRKVNFTKYLKRRRKGIFGYTLAFYAVTEAHAKGTLHTHIILWGGLPPHLLERIAHCDELCREVAKILDYMYCATLPRHVHVYDLLEREMRRQTFTRDSLVKPPSLLLPIYPSSVDLYQKRVDDTTHSKNINTHTFTCKKPPDGFHACRVCKPSGCVCLTKPVQLKLIERGPNKEVTFSVDDIISRPEESTTIIPTPDKRVIVWELMRPTLEELPIPPSDLTGDSLQSFMINTLQQCCGMSWTHNIKQWLSKLKTENLMNTYLSVSKDLPQRNGWVVD